MKNVFPAPPLPEMIILSPFRTESINSCEEKVFEFDTKLFSTYISLSQLEYLFGIVFLHTNSFHKRVLNMAQTIGNVFATLLLTF